MYRTSDGGLIQVGTSGEPLSSGTSDMWIVKTNNDGTVGCGLDNDVSATVTDTSANVANSAANTANTSATVNNSAATVQNSTAAPLAKCH